MWWNENKGGGEYLQKLHPDSNWYIYNKEDLGFTSWWWYCRVACHKFQTLSLNIGWHRPRWIFRHWMIPNGWIFIHWWCFGKKVHWHHQSQTYISLFWNRLLIIWRVYSGLLKCTEYCHPFLTYTIHVVLENIKIISRVFQCKHQN